MQLDIQAQGFDLTDGLRQHTRRRVDFTLSWATDYLRRISIRLSDQNGPRGGADKRCCISIAVPGSADVVVEDTETDLYVAIDRAVDRAGRSVARRIERHRARRRLLPVALE